MQIRRSSPFSLVSVVTLSLFLSLVWGLLSPLRGCIPSRALRMASVRGCDMRGQAVFIRTTIGQSACLMMFCWYRMLWSVVMRTSKPASAQPRSSKTPLPSQGIPTALHSHFDRHGRKAARRKLPEAFPLSNRTFTHGQKPWHGASWATCCSTASHLPIPSRPPNHSMKSVIS